MSFDAHTHLSAGAVDLSDLDLRALAGPDALEARVAAAAASRPRGTWIRGWGWDGIAAPRDVARDHPVFLARRDGHAAWINSAGRSALDLEGRAASGVLEEEAFDRARHRVPDQDPRERIRAIVARLDEARGLGIAALDDFVEPWGPEAYGRLRRGARLPLTVGMWLPETLAPGEAEAVAREFPTDDPAVAVRGVKLFLDGTLGARTAALFEPYADAPETRGALRFPEAEILERVRAWASRGWPVAVHAIGDRAVSCALDAFERVPAPRWGAHRIEHAQVVRRRDLPRFAAARVVASVQPGHWRDDRDWLVSRLGERPDVVAHPFASFFRAGAAVVCGSDWPVSSWDPASIREAASDPGRGPEAGTAC